LILLLVGLYASLASIALIPLFVYDRGTAHREALGNWPAALDFAPFTLPHSVNAVILLPMAVFAAVRSPTSFIASPEAEASLSPPEPSRFLQHHPPAGAIFNTTTGAAT